MEMSVGGEMIVTVIESKSEILLSPRKHFF